MVKNLFKALLDHSGRALRRTGSLYRNDNRGRRELYASGVFFRYRNRHFVLSAAHALVELRTGPVWVGGEATIVQLAGPFFHTGRSGQTDFENDSFDVGFVPLGHDQVSALTDVVYVSERAVEKGHSSAREPYFAVGFIASDFRPSASRSQVTVEGTGIMAVEGILTTRQWPPWWTWELELSAHLLKRMEDRAFNEVDCVACLNTQAVTVRTFWKDGLSSRLDTPKGLGKSLLSQTKYDTSWW